MTGIPPPSTSPVLLIVPAKQEDDGSFTISKLKAASESLRCFNDALTRIGEAASEDDRLRPPPPDRDRPPSPP